MSKKQRRMRIRLQNAAAKLAAAKCCVALRAAQRKLSAALRAAIEEAKRDRRRQ